MLKFFFVGISNLLLFYSVAQLVNLPSTLFVFIGLAMLAVGLFFDYQFLKQCRDEFIDHE